MRKFTNQFVADNNYNKISLFDFSPNPNPDADPNPVNRLNPGSWIHDSVSDGGYVTFNLGSYSRNQLKELSKRLISELEQVRVLRDRLEAGEFEPRPVCASPEIPAARSVTCDGDAAGANDGAGAPSGAKKKKKKGRGLKWGNSFGAEGPERGRVAAAAAADPVADKAFASMMRRCGQILGKLMKNKWSWVFNQPVDVAGLGLHDYYQIIKKPMDLGTIKLNLEKGLYRCPLDFAADVRLTFNNALTYNPKGQDVYMLAEKLLQEFEEMFNPAYKKFEVEHHKFVKSMAESSSHQPEQLNSGVRNQNRVAENVRRGPEPISIAKKLESVKPSMLAVELEPLPLPSPPPQLQQVVATVEQPVEMGEKLMRKGKLPKPKAKDPNKRLMTMEEKGKLGLSLQELPPEKLGQLLHILRKRNDHLADDVDEIELDIEAIDNETLWELDRFVVNYKKMVSKIKRQGFIQNQISTTVKNSALVNEMGDSEKKGKKGDAGEEDVDIGEDLPMANYPSVEIEKDATAAAASRGSSSSGGSSSSSGSSTSSDSDSGSSSGSDSDGNSVQSPLVESKEGR